MCAYPSVLASQLQAQLKRKQQKEENFLIYTSITYEIVTVMSMTGHPCGSYCRNQ